MTSTETAIPGVLVLEPKVYADARGFFFESFNERQFHEVVGGEWRFVQDNVSWSTAHVLRGIHYQIGRPQGKLVQVLSGEVFDVAVDLRRSSPTFGRWAGMLLSAANQRQVWIPPGFGHGFLVTASEAKVAYKTTDYYAPDEERTIAWDDPELAIAWPLSGRPIVSAKDAAGLRLADADVYP
jgi:dTDP-4-dehydrorhamnose 3,5-epimerase